VPTDHFEVLGKGTLESLVEKGQVAEGSNRELKLVEIGLHDVTAGVGRIDGLTVIVGDAAGLIGKKAKVRIERVVDGIAYATLRGGAPKPEAPITAEGEAEKPTRKPPAKKGQKPEPEPEVGAEAEPEPEAVEPEAEEKPEQEAETPVKPKKKTRRGSRGGRNRRRKTAAAAAASNGEVEQSGDGQGGEPAPRIHLPDPELGREDESENGREPDTEPVQAESGNDQDGAEQPKPKKKTRRGSRGGRNRRKKAGTKSQSAPSE
jgi:predicted RNA-binding protein with TRAM domain